MRVRPSTSISFDFHYRFVRISFVRRPIIDDPSICFSPFSSRKDAAARIIPAVKENLEQPLFCQSSYRHGSAIDYHFDAVQWSPLESSAHMIKI